MANPQPTPQAPEWFPLPPDHDKHLTDILVYWEKSSAKVERYRCNFTRWTYDPTFIARDPKTGELPAMLIGSGEIKYAAPDKGLLREDEIKKYVPPQPPNQKFTHQVSPAEKKDHWVCDGKSIFAFDYANKKLIQTELPPDMQGKAIVDGPLPFMFGAEVNKVKDRFWVRVMPSDASGEYKLEAIPKRREDAANFKSIQIIIDIISSNNEKYALPKAMAIFDRSPSFQTFAFEKREVNWSSTISEKINFFGKEFYEPTTPPGFKKVIERLPPSAAEKRVANTEKNVANPAQPNANGPTFRPANAKANDPTLYYSKEPMKR